MRDIVRFFRQTYRAVRTSDADRSDSESPPSAPPPTTTIACDALGGLKSSDAPAAKFVHPDGTLSANRRHRRTLRRDFSILDVFFNQPKRGRGPRWPKGIFLLKAAGLLAIISAIVLYILQPYDAIFRWKLIFAENGEIFNLWQNPPVELYIKVYLYNITNAQAFLDGKEPKMRVEQVGPYVYREKLVHTDVRFNDNGTLSTVPKHPLIWNEAMSMGNREDDMFMLPNIALLSIAQVTADKSFFFRTPINMLIRNTQSQPIVRMTAREFMFGYTSTITTLGHQLMPDWIYFDKVGLIDRMYDFDGDFETIYTGETDRSISGLIDTYRGSRHLPQWNNAHCSDIQQASDGTKFKSFIEPNETLLFYRKSMCRAQRMTRIGTEELRIGNLNAYRYEFEANALDNGVYDERNKCFCRTPSTCLPAGLIDVSSCYYGFPIALSYPHFLDADPAIQEHVLGSSPNRSEHTTYFMIQPKSGLPLNLSVKMQINLAMKDVSNMAHVGQFSNIVLPMLWFDITMLELPPSLKTRFNLYLNILPVTDALGQLLLFGLGIVLVLLAIMRAALLFSRTMRMSSSHSQSAAAQSLGGGKYAAYRRSSAEGSGCGVAGVLLSTAYRDVESNVDSCDEDYGEAVMSYEMSEKCIRNDEDVVLYEIDLSVAGEFDNAASVIDDDDEAAFMLERERALSEQTDSDDSDEATNSDNASGSADSGQRSMSYEDNATLVEVSNLCTENQSFDRDDDLMLLHSNNAELPVGALTSSLEDIGTDAFPGQIEMHGHDGPAINAANDELLGDQLREQRQQQQVLINADASESDVCS